MDAHLEKALVSWLAAERAEEPEADLHLYQVFGALPPPAPAAGFADRVLAAAGVAAAPPAWLRQAKAGVAALLGLAGVVLVLVAGVALPLLGMVRPAGMVQLVARGVAAASHLLAEVVTVLDRLFELARSIASALSTPEVALGTLLLTALSAVALRLLSELIVREREAYDAQSA